MKKNKLRIAFITNSAKIEKWKHQLIASISEAQYLKEILIISISNDEGKNQNNSTFFKKSFLLDSYLKLDQKLFKPLPNAEEIIVFNHNYCQVNFSNDILKIKNSTFQTYLKDLTDRQLDVIIDLTNKNKDFSILNISKYGIWYLKLADSKQYDSKYDGINETITRNDTLNSYLLAKNSNDEQYQLFKSKSFINHLSLSKTRNEHIWKSSLFISRKLEQLYKEGENFYNLYPIQVANRSEMKIHALPSSLSIMGHACRTLSTIMSNQILKKYRFQQWILLFKFSDDFVIDKSLESFLRIEPPKDRIWADPFTFIKDSRYYIFIEEMLLSDNKGFISVMELFRDGTFSKPVKIIENDYHMSYPFLFEHENNLYMIPETGSNKTIELYKCSEFPYKWEYTKTLRKGVKSVDTTFFEHDNKYWIFTNEKQIEGVSAHEELFLYYTDDIINGEWKAHPKNPIVSDVSCARSAGNIFFKGKRIFRPAQNCSKRYGYGIKIQEIIKLNEHDYEEYNINSIYPDWANDLKGTHTINSTDDLIVIDALVNKF